MSRAWSHTHTQTIFVQSRVDLKSHSMLYLTKHVLFKLISKTCCHHKKMLQGSHDQKCNRFIHGKFQQKTTWQILKQPGLISSDLHLSIKCNCQTYDDNIGPKLKKPSYVVFIMNHALNCDPIALEVISLILSCLERDLSPGFE